MTKAFPFVQQGVEFIMAVRNTLYVDIFASYSGKLHMVKSSNDVTYKVDGKPFFMQIPFETCGVSDLKECLLLQAING